MKPLPLRIPQRLTRTGLLMSQKIHLDIHLQVEMRSFNIMMRKVAATIVTKTPPLSSYFVPV